MDTVEFALRSSQHDNKSLEKVSVRPGNGGVVADRLDGVVRLGSRR
nr:hypothetical protein [Kibdelosporangium sp. MJ126-NF4]